MSDDFLPRFKPIHGITAVLALAIFVTDTITDTEIAVSALYVAVVLLSLQFSGKRGVIVIASGCILLTVTSFFLSNSAITQTGLTNEVISIAAVIAATYLALQATEAKTAVKMLADSENLRNALIGSVSHELRTPLVSILGGASVLSQTPEISSHPKLRSLANDIRDEANRLNSDIQNLLDAARIATQTLPTHWDWTDPADVIQAAVERVRSRYSNKLVVGPVDNLPLVRIDPVLVEQALAQIISNAAKFSTPDDGVRIGTSVDSNALTITVSDDGAGLTTFEKGQIPKKFFRGERHVGKVHGSGLGLWIANTFIESNHGKMTIASDGEHRGTTVQIKFPLASHGRLREREAD